MPSGTLRDRLIGRSGWPVWLCVIVLRRLARRFGGWYGRVWLVCG